MLPNRRHMPAGCLGGASIAGCVQAACQFVPLEVCLCVSVCVYLTIDIAELARLVLAIPARFGSQTAGAAKDAVGHLARQSCRKRSWSCGSFRCQAWSHRAFLTLAGDGRSKRFCPGHHANLAESWHVLYMSGVGLGSAFAVNKAHRSGSKMP